MLQPSIENQTRLVQESRRYPCSAQLKRTKMMNSSGLTSTNRRNRITKFSSSDMPLKKFQRLPETLRQRRFKQIQNPRREMILSGAVAGQVRDLSCGCL